MWRVGEELGEGVLEAVVEGGCGLGEGGEGVGGAVELVQLAFEDAIELCLGQRLQLFGEVYCGCKDSVGGTQKRV